MSICQTVTALSAKIEALRGVVAGLFEHAFFIAKHDHHRGCVGGIELTQSQFATTVEGICSFPQPFGPNRGRLSRL